jgi:hypothetical protein
MVVRTNTPDLLGAFVDGFNAAITENLPLAVNADEQLRQALQLRLNRYVAPLKNALVQFRTTKQNFPYAQVTNLADRASLRNSNNLTVSTVQNVINFIQTEAIDFYNGDPILYRDYVFKYYISSQSLIYTIETGVINNIECFESKWDGVGDLVAKFKPYLDQIPSSNIKALDDVTTGFPNLETKIAAAVAFVNAENDRLTACTTNVNACITTYVNFKAQVKFSKY